MERFDTRKQQMVEKWLKSSFSKIPKEIIIKAFGENNVDDLNRISWYKAICKECNNVYYSKEWDIYNEKCSSCEKETTYTLYQLGKEEHLANHKNFWLVENKLVNDRIYEVLKEISELEFKVYEIEINDEIKLLLGIEPQLDEKGVLEKFNKVFDII